MKTPLSRIHRLIPLFAAGLLGAFFLPWFIVFGEPASGYALGRLGEFFVAVWAVPALALLTLAAGILGRRSTLLPVLTGLSPFLLLVLGSATLLFTGGQEAFAQAGRMAARFVTLGGYLTLLCGAALAAAALFTPRPVQASTH